jgi:hypothetical protein
MIFVIHSDDIAATFFVRFFIDLFLRFPFIGFFHFLADAARCKNRMCPRRVIFLRFQLGGFD